MNKDRDYSQYNSGDLVYTISPLMSQLKTASRKFAIKYVGLLVIYKFIDPHNYLLITLDGKLLRGLYEHEWLKSAVIRTYQGNVTSLSKFETGNDFRVIRVMKNDIKKLITWQLHLIKWNEISD